MNSQNQIQDDLSHIRSMMEKSSRFISLSGLSGVFAGITAVVAAGYVYLLLRNNQINYFEGKGNVYSLELINHIILVGLVALVVAVGFGYFFTANKSKKKGAKMWDATSKRLLTNFSIPLLTGGVFCLALIYHGLIVFLAPVTLIFYGLALVNAAKFTFTDVEYLGYLEIALGLISLFFLGLGLLFWIIGFGVLHIIYRLVMHKKYK